MPLEHIITIIIIIIITISCMYVKNLLNQCKKERNINSPLFRLNLLAELYESIRSRDELDCRLRRREEFSHEDILQPHNLNTETIIPNNCILNLSLLWTADIWRLNTIRLKAQQNTIPWRVEIQCPKSVIYDGSKLYWYNGDGYRSWGQFHWN